MSSTASLQIFTLPWKPADLHSHPLRVVAQLGLATACALLHFG